MGDRKPLTAAGGIVWRDGRDGPEILLVHRPDHQDWSLPKGKPDPGENELDTAVREVTEETGLRFTLGARLGSVTYHVEKRPKTVTYWAMRLDPGHTADPQPQDDSEIDDLAWHSISSAREILSYSEDDRMLHAFTERGLAPVSLILVRHGMAGKRSEWSGDDSARPLDDRGIAQAAAIGRTVGAFAPKTVVSAPLTRCIQTAEPLSCTIGLPIDQSPLVADKALKKAGRKALKQVCGWAAGDRTRVVVSQGNLIGAALDKLIGGKPGSHSRQKGSAWVFCAHGGRIVAADYYSSFLSSDDR